MSKAEENNWTNIGNHTSIGSPDHIHGFWKLTCPLCIEPLNNYRYFLRENMPRIQYNNPLIQFEVQKVQQPGVSPELTIEFGK